MRIDEDWKSTTHSHLKKTWSRTYLKSGDDEKRQRRLVRKRHHVFDKKIVENHDWEDEKKSRRTTTIDRAVQENIRTIDEDDNHDV